MDQVLVYGDSLAWGIVPHTRERLRFELRWPGVLEGALRVRGIDVRIVEDCLNGRRTAFEDPYKPGRNGLSGLPQAIEAHSPLAAVIVMLGTNDFQSMHPHNAWHSAQGLAAVVQAIRTAPIEPGMPKPPIVVVAPPPFGQPEGPIAPKFEGAPSKAAGLAQAVKQVCQQHDCVFFDAGQVTPASRNDGVHLDADQHANLGDALSAVVARVLAAASTSV